MRPRRSLGMSILTVLGAIVVGVIGLALLIPAALFLFALVVIL